MTQRSRLETILIMAAISLAILFRFVQLGEVPLHDREARLALQALQLARGETIVLEPEPGYLLGTSALFFLFGDSNTTARLIPAIFGILVVVVPLFFRREIGSLPAAILSMGLAIDPGLIAFSRQAGGAMIALSAGLLAAALLWRRRPAAGGILAGVALLGGPVVWAGLLALVFTWALFWILQTSRELQMQEQKVEVEESRAPFPWRQAAGYALASFLVLGSLFFIQPFGISAAAQSLVNYLSGWVSPSGLGVVPPLMALAGYVPLAIVFAVVQLAQRGGNHQPVDRFLLFFALFTLGLALLMPGRRYAFLVWPVVPLWALAARSISRLQLGQGAERLWTVVVALAFMFMAIFTWYNLVALTSGTTSPANSTVQISVIGGVLVILVGAVLIAWAWSTTVALRGLAWAAAAVLLVVGLRASVQVTRLSTQPAAQLWQEGSWLPQAGYLADTIGDLSEWSRGDRLMTSVLVEQIDSPALEWLLRDYRSLRRTSVASPELEADIILNQDQSTLLATGTFRGQDFTWRVDPFVQQLPLSTWSRWLVRRELPLVNDSVIVWAKNELFPGGIPDPTSSSIP